MFSSAKNQPHPFSSPLQINDLRTYLRNVNLHLDKISCIADFFSYKVK